MSDLLTHFRIIKARDEGFLVMDDQTRMELTFPLCAGTLDQCLDYLRRRLSEDAQALTPKVPLTASTTRRNDDWRSV